MNGRKADQAGISCQGCRAGLQEYMDGTMAKTESLRIFLHLRECAACEREFAQLQATFQLLDTLPALDPPDDFDRRILESVPYASYRAMADLRRPRVPVFLEAETLPSVVRSLRVRLAGLTIAVASVAAMVFFAAPHALSFPAVAGLLPEAVVRLQGLGRVTVMAVRRSGG